MKKEDVEYFPLEELDFSSCKEEEPKVDTLVKDIKAFMEKHELTFIEALEVIKFYGFNSELENMNCYLDSIKDSIYELDRTLMGVQSGLEKIEKSNLNY